MLYVLTLLFNQNANACEALNETASLLQSFPSNGSLEVAIDSVIRLEFGAGVLPEGGDFRLLQDGISLELEKNIIIDNTDLTDSHRILELAPVGEMEPNQEFVLEQDGQRIMTFVTAEERATPIKGFPLIQWADQYFYDQSEYEELSNCEAETKTDIYVEFAPDKLAEGQAIIMYRVDDAFSEPSIEQLEDPFFMVLDPQETSYINTSLENTSVDDSICFVTAYVNSAGQIGEMSSPVCTTEFDYGEWVCGTSSMYGMFSCSTMSADGFAWMSLGLGFVGLSRRARRRRK